MTIRHPDCMSDDDRPRPPGWSRLNPPPRTHDSLRRAFPISMMQNGRAVLTYEGRKSLRAMRAGLYPRRYPLAQLRMVETAIRMSVECDAAVLAWRKVA